MDNAPAPAASPAPSDELIGVGSLLSSATTVTLDNAGVIFGVWAVCGLPPQLLGMALSARAGLADKNALRAAFESRDWSVLGPLAAIGAVSLIFGLFGYATTVLLTARAHQGRPLALGDALFGGAGRVISSAVASVIVACAVLSGTLAFVIPGLFLMVRLSLAVCATAVEEAGPFTAVARSWTLTSGHFWDVVVRMGAFVGVALAGMVAVIFGGLILGALAALAGGPGAIAARLIVNAFQFMLTAWVTACVTKLFLDLASRRPAA
jgi:uncharacterized membrane protein